MLNLNSIMIGTKQPKVLAAFYEKVLGKPAEMVGEESGFYGWQAGLPFLCFGPLRNGWARQRPRARSAQFLKLRKSKRSLRESGP